MKKFFFLVMAIVVIAAFAFFYRFQPIGITGFYPKGNTTVEVSGLLKGEISALVYRASVEFAQIQDIEVEFTNTGSEAYNVKIEVTLYWNNNSKLQQMAYYYDSEVLLNPGMARTYKISFLPPNLGLYYIKVKVNYDSRVVEKWGAFYVVYTVTPQPIYIITPSPTPTPVQEVGPASMGLEYPQNVTIVRGETKLFSILVKNTGNVSLNNVSLYISTSNLIDFEINPKIMPKLLPNNSVIFLISVYTPNTTPEGKYPFDFKVMSDKVREGRSIDLEVTSIPPPIGEDVYNTILNYQYLINEIQHEIDDAASSGIDVRIPQFSLDKAKVALEIARDYYDRGMYEDAKKKLEEVRGYLEDAVLQLALANIVIIMPSYLQFLFVLILIVIPIIFFVFWKRRKKEKEKEKKPKLLRSTEETET